MLETIQSPADLRNLTAEERKTLCAELRSFLLQTVSKTGGHLGSNLGVVELTVAIHTVFDTSRDRLVFDVGHQCYVHKALTGRRELMHTLRQFGGLAGFPKPAESEHDAFVAGHSSTSVSVALGMARARTLQSEDYSVLALIGDGALTGGLAYEGLNDAGDSNEPLIVILNDNGMSINPNVGGVSSHLATIRTRPGYHTFKKHYRAVVKRLPGGQKIYQFTHHVKTAMKKFFWPCTMFEDMGFTYLGPVDGHDVEKLCTSLRWAKELNRPVLLHVKTKKGKGYSFAEENPDQYHGVGPFDLAVGVQPKTKPDFSAVFGETLAEIAGEDDRVCAITAAMGEGTGLDRFARRHPKRFFDVGIAEGHAVAMAGGMAKQGMLPVFAVYSSFLQRGYDEMIHDVALQKLHVVLGLDRSGLVGADGATHHGLSDVAFLTSVPGMKVYSPSSFAELKGMLRQAVLSDEGPAALRYPRGGEGAYAEPWSGENSTCLREGTEVTVVSYGTIINEVLAALDGSVSAEIIKLNVLAPLDASAVVESVRKTGRLVVVEECFATGGIGQQLCAALERAGIAAKELKLLSCGSDFVHQGSVAQLYHSLGIDAEGIRTCVNEVCHGESET